MTSTESARSETRLAINGRRLAHLIVLSPQPAGRASIGWPVCTLYISFSRFRSDKISRAWISMSVAKSFISAMIGIAVHDGKIGSIVAQVGRAFGMRVLCWGRDGSTSRAKAAGFDL